MTTNDITPTPEHSHSDDVTPISDDQVKAMENLLDQLLAVNALEALIQFNEEKARVKLHQVQNKSALRSIAYAANTLSQLCQEIYSE